MKEDKDTSYTWIFLIVGVILIIQSIVSSQWLTAAIGGVLIGIWANTELVKMFKGEEDEIQNNS